MANHFLGRKVKIIEENPQLSVEPDYLVIGESPTGLLLFHHSINGHSGDGMSDIEFMKGFEYRSSRADNCWCVGKGKVKIIDTFRDIFNKLEVSNEKIR